MATATSFVTVYCPGCGLPREISTRQARRAGLCRACLHPPKIPPVTDIERRFWLKILTDDEIAATASAIWGYQANPEVIHRWRETLLPSQETVAVL